MFYKVDRCLKDLTTVQTVRCFTRKKALELAESNLKSYGHGSIVHGPFGYVALVGPLGHQTVDWFPHPDCPSSMRIDGPGRPLSPLALPRYEMRTRTEGE